LAQQFVRSTPEHFSLEYFEDVAPTHDGEYVYASGVLSLTAFRHTQVECAPVPTNDCFQTIAPGKAKLLIKDRDPLQADQIVWKWQGGPVAMDAFGDPAGTLNDYAICLYGGVGGGVVIEAVVPAGGGCGAATAGGATPCWAATPSGFI